LNILIAGYQHETNTFAPTLAGWDAFTAGHTFPAYRRGAGMAASFTGVNIPIGGFIAAAQQHGWHLIESVWAGATPSSYVTADAFDRIADEIVHDVRQAMSTGLDAIYLDLHGAAVAHNADDSEGELLARIRAVTGDALPIVASLDLHANVTHRMLQLADALVSYRTYPHVDMADTGRLAASLLERRMQRGTREPLHYQRFPYLIPLNSQSTWMQPAKRLYDELIALDQQHGTVLSFCMGFPAADFAECAPMVWGYGDAAQEAVSALYKSALPAAQWDPGVKSVREAVALAIERAAHSQQPIVIADTQDNPGAGGDSNTTGVLHELLRQGAGERFPGRVAIGMVFDPQAALQAHAVLPVSKPVSVSVSVPVSEPVLASNQPVVQAFTAQAAIKIIVTTTIVTSVGKAVPTFTGQLSDAPVQGTWTVEHTSDGNCVYTGPMMTGVTARLGPSAALRLDGIRVAVVSGKAQLLDRQLLRMVGIDAEDMKIIVVKSSNHFRADFTPLVANPALDIIVVKAAGPMAADPADLPWKKLQVSAKLPSI
jgi:microcystin degradation protein MlrC